MTPLPEVMAEARRVSDAVSACGLELRLTGGIAIAMRCPSTTRAPLERPHKDIDLVGRASERTRIAELAESLGYQPQREFNLLNGRQRLIFVDQKHGRDLDIFLDRIVGCHTIDLDQRLGLPGPTLSLADLLLSKLQIYQTTDKDFVDILALLVDHDFADDDSGINLPHLVKLGCEDWGLWRTTTMVAERAGEFAATLRGFEHTARVQAQARRYVDALAEAPKSRAWRLRARIGDRKRWYELPEEESQ
jgi:hypothetical protein